MGYLDGSTITVDAILTKKGRSLLASGQFNITQFALSDDDVDYTTYNPNHPSGSGFFGEAIQNMPVLEAFPDDNQIMKYKLVTLPRGTSKLPVISAGYNIITLAQGAQLVINPQTLNYLGAVSAFEPSGYVATMADQRLLSTFTGTGIDTTGLTVNDINSTAGTALSFSAIGTSFTMIATTVNTLFGTNQTVLSTTLTIIGRDSGARISIPLNVTLNQ